MMKERSLCPSSWESSTGVISTSLSWGLYLSVSGASGISLELNGRFIVGQVLWAMVRAQAHSLHLCERVWCRRIRHFTVVLKLLQKGQVNVLVCSSVV